MDKLNIINVFRRRRITKIVSILSFFVLLVIVSLMFVSKNPKPTKAFNLVQTSTDCTVSGPGTYPLLLDTLCDNKNLTIDGDVNGDGQDGTVVEISGSHPFNNVTIKNGATLTHPAFASTDIITSDKKIDLVITGNLTLDTGGLINVDSKGYLGGNASTSTNGYGLGGGVFHHSTTRYSGAGGGSFKGAGGAGVTAAGAVYNQLDPQNNPAQIQPGSGGGGALSDINNCKTTGGSGGGRIRIKVNTIFIRSNTSFITANGGTPTIVTPPGDCRAAGGGGSGGTIWLEVNNIEYSALPTTAEANGGTITNTGSVGAIEVSPITAAAAKNMKSNGGNTLNYAGFVIGGSGGGGHIVVKYLNTSGMTVRKYLSPRRRPATAATDSQFDPYSLQDGDHIQVNIYITNAPVGTITPMKDYFLKTNGAYVEKKCIYDETKFHNIQPTAHDQYSISWDYTATKFGESDILYYGCVVQ